MFQDCSSCEFAGFGFSCICKYRVLQWARSGKKVYPVRGTVTYRGEPAEGVELNFAPVKDSPDVTFATGISGAGGEFQLSTYKQYDGAPSGDYIVTAFWPDRRKGATKVVAAAGEELAPDRLKGEYSNPKTSKLQATVLEGPTDLKIDIK